MDRILWITGCIVAALVLATVVAAPADAATVPDYTVTYTVTVSDDGSAVWQVEYRTLLATDNDTAAFGEYSAAIDSIYLPQFRELMEHSAAQASIATSRTMTVSGFSGTSDIQTSPTGKYGVILYSFTWHGFARPGTEMMIGDAFASGMYLSKDTTLVIRYPSGWTVTSMDPVPDTVRDGLTWYGQRSFGPGEPRIVLAQSGSPLPMALAGFVVILLAGGAVFVLVKRKRQSDAVDPPEPAALPLSEAEIVSLGERIIQMIRANGGEMYQSGIVKNLGLPKSTVSNALNDLHERGLVLKVKKGRENLIRLPS